MITFDPSIESRVADLLSKMSWDEKVAQLGSIMPFTDWGEFSRSTLPERIKKVVEYPPEQASAIGHLSMFLRELPPRDAARKSNEICRYALEHGGIPPLIHDEGLHGLLANDGTSFPQSIHMASSWDPALLEEIAQAIGKETRHVWHTPAPLTHHQYCQGSTLRTHRRNVWRRSHVSC